MAELFQNYLTMKQKTIFILMSAVLIIAMTACGGGSDDTPDSPKPPIVNPDDPGGNDSKPTYTLTVSSTTINFERGGGQKTVTITTNATSWTAKSNAAWCKTSQNGSTLTISADVNTETTERTATIAVTATGVSQQQTIVVAQAAGTNDPYLVVGTNLSQIIFDDRGGEQTFDIKTNYDDWTVKSDNDMVMVTKISASQVSVKCVTRPENSGKYTRRTNILFLKADGETLASLVVVQDPKPSFEGTDDFRMVNPQGETSSFRIGLNTSTFTATTTATWLTVEAVTESEFNHYLTIVVTPRKEDEQPRYATIEMKAHYATFTMIVFDRDGTRPNPSADGDGFKYEDPTPWD